MPVADSFRTELGTQTNRELARGRAKADRKRKSTFGRPHRCCAKIPSGRRTGMLDRRASRDERIGGELDARSNRRLHYRARLGLSGRLALNLGRKLKPS